MSQTQTFVFKGPNSSRDLNNHVAKILAYGPYHGLMVEATNPVSLQANITPGYGFTDEGVKWRESLTVPNAFNFNAGDANNPRTDLCVARHRYNPAEGTNPVQYVVIPGIPQSGPYVPTADYASMQEGDIPLAEVTIPANATVINPSDIFNLARVPTTVELRKQVSKALYYALHNFKLEGWNLTHGILDVTVSPGNGLLCGFPNGSTTDQVITNIRRQSYITPEIDPVSGTPYVLSDHVPVVNDPDFGTRLQFNITTHGSALLGNIKITGTDIHGNPIVEELVPVDMAESETKTYTSQSIYAVIAANGIDFVPADPTNWPLANDATVSILDMPVYRIIVMGSQSGNARFKAVVDPAYVLPCNEMVLGTVKTDLNGITDMTPIDVLPGSFVTEDLSPQCNGITKTFYVNNNTLAGSEMLVIDGTILHNSATQPKGFTLNGTTITLGSAVPAPDGDNTDMWYRYKPA